MNRTLMRVTAVALAGAASAWPLAALAYHGAEASPGAPGSVEVLLAYIDPGAGGFIIVSVLGFISAVGYMARSYLARVKDAVFRRRPSAGAAGGAGAGGEEDEC